jgi:hypothetical protein
MPLSNLSKLLKRDVTIIRREESGDEDTYGNDIPKVTNLAVKGELQQRSRDEAEGTISQTNWLLILPAGTPIDGNDAVVVDGDTYEIIGDPWPAWNPRLGRYEHIEVTLRRTSGQPEGLAA